MFEAKEWVGRPVWGGAVVEVQVCCFDVLWVEQGHGACDVEAPVAALGYVFAVAELEHQFVAAFGVLLYCEAAGAGALAEAVVGERDDHDVEGWLFGAVALGEFVKYFEAFVERAGPAMDEEEGYGIFDGGLLVEEMDLERRKAFDCD